MDDAGVIQFVTDEIEPPVIEPPQNLTAQVINDKDVKLEWDGENLPFSDGFESGDFVCMERCS